MKKIKIYLDNCCFNRPYDDQEQQKIYLETVAILFIQQKIIDDTYELVWSYILDYENSENPDIESRFAIQKWEKLAKEIIISSVEIVEIAKDYHKKGFGVKDSLHISCAVNSKCDFFITVDKGILKRKDLIKDINILNPMDFIEQEEDL